MSLFWLALSFLTTIPTKQIPYIPGGLGKSAALFPLIGLLIGSIVTAVIWFTQFLFPIPIAALLGLLTWVLLTGGLHLDGLADCCDGLMGAATADKRLEILKDSRIGAFALIGLIIAISLKWIVLVVILNEAGLRFTWLPFLLAPVLARFLILPTALQPQARPDGMGSDFATTITPFIFAVAAAIPLGLAAFSGWQMPIQTITAVALACTGTGWWIYLARTRIGGVTGDVYGTVVETAEILVLLGFTILF